MPEREQLPGQLRFGVFEVDLRAGELRKHGLRVRLQEQPFQVLAMLLEHVGEVVTREELQKKLWSADTFVDFDHGLNKAINKIREALGDSAESPRFVETLARRGYRFLADVRVTEETANQSARQESQVSDVAGGGTSREPAAKSATGHRIPSSLGWKIFVLVLFLVAGSLSIWKLSNRNPRATVIRSLAVLPLESLSGDATQDYFADGMTDELISDLGQISALRVISRTSVMAYKHTLK